MTTDRLPRLLPAALELAYANAPGMAAAWRLREQGKAKHGGQRRESNPRPRPESSRSEALHDATPRIGGAATPLTYPDNTAHDQSITLDDAALESWANGLTTRIGLQSELVWVGLNDGYTDAGGKDVAIPYLGLYWILGHTIKGQHCQTCLLLSFGNPYDPPGTPGGKTIYQSPGDGQTECGAGCKCWLEYGLPNASLPRNYAWKNNVFPGPGKATPEIGQSQLDRAASRYGWGEAMLLDPNSEAFTDEQKGALDLFRAKWFAWEDVRGDLPQAPKMFADEEAAQALEDLDAYWDQMTPQQRDILMDLQEAILGWNAATAQANLEASGAAEALRNLPDETTLAELREMSDDQLIQLFGFGGFFGRIFGGGGRAGGNSGHMGMIGTSGRHVIRDGEGHYAGSTKGAPKEKAPSSRGRGKGEEEQSSRGISRRATSSHEKSPNEGAERRGSAQRKGRTSEEEQMRQAEREGEHAAKAFRNTHDDSHIRGGGLGQKTPFTRVEFERSLGHLKGLNKVGASGGVNKTGIATLNGHEYIVKRITKPYRDPSRQGIRETEQQAQRREAFNEVMASRMAQALGMRDSAPHEAYVMEARVGLLRKSTAVYSVQRLAPEKPLADKPFGEVSQHRLDAFDHANAGDIGMKRLMAEYLTGPVDRHEGNVLFDERSENVRMIDFGRDFSRAKGFSPRITALGNSVLRGRGAHQSAYAPEEFGVIYKPLSEHEMRAIALPHAMLHSVTSRAARIAAATRHADGRTREAIQARMDILRRLEDMAHPTMYDWITVSNGTTAFRDLPEYPL